MLENSIPLQCQRCGTVVEYALNLWYITPKEKVCADCYTKAKYLEYKDKK